MSISNKFQKLRTELDELYQIEGCLAVLGYDQQVLMPPAAAPGRARQLECLNTIHHQKLSSDSLWDLTRELSAQQEKLNFDQKVIVRELYRQIERSRKLPLSFIAEKTRVGAEGFSIWTESRPNNDWQKVKPYLKRIVELSREESGLIGYEQHPYDPMLDAFEPYSKLATIKPNLLALGERLKKALPYLQEQSSLTGNIQGNFETGSQAKACHAILKKLGFDFDAGRLDTAAHPFMSSLGPRDIRVTTRYNPNSFLPAVFGVIHEFGHALYEMGLPEEFKGTPRGSAVSMAIHESQSRLWENIVARSRAFSVYLSEMIQQFFALNISAELIWQCSNKVKASLIRVEADEVSYSLHIIIRMILEENLMSGELNVEELPESWNQLYLDYLGVSAPEHKNGLMQDVHWYSGAIGYFPSYALGNLYAAMFIEEFEKQNNNLAALIEEGKFSELSNWLRNNIYSLGQSYSAEELVKNVCGKTLSFEPFLHYLSSKHNYCI